MNRLELSALCVAAASLVCLAACNRAVPPAPAVAATTAPKHRAAAPVAPATPVSPGGLSAGLDQLKPRKSGTAVKDLASPRFVDSASDAGLHAVYDNGAGGQLMVEGTGGGAGWLDYDGDGAWDLYFVQGGRPVSRSDRNASDHLFRNVGPLQFENVTELAGIAETHFGQGVCIGDYDNDGFQDIFVSNVGRDALFRNQGDGTFIDLSSEIPSGDSWSTSAAWSDIDLDGDLDLYVGRYCEFDPDHPVICRNAQGQVAMCQPKQVPPIPDALFVNQGDGRFLEAAQQRGLHGPENRALGVVAADFNNDGWPDILVGNDASPNFLFINHGQGRFVESAVPLGCSLMQNGQAQGSMGIAPGDFDRNGFLDFFVANFEGEGDTLYQNEGPLGFHEASGKVGLVVPTLPMVGWGTVLADFNHDGQDDLIVLNGHIADGRNAGGDMAQHAQLFSYDGTRWLDFTGRGGPYFAERHLGRGAAACDIDGDGDIDLFCVHQNSPAALLVNQARGNHWLSLELRGTKANRHGVGARVILEQAGRRQTQQCVGGASYCSASWTSLNFGLGSHSESCSITIHWPGGAVQRLDDIPSDQQLLVRESTPVASGEHSP